MSKLQWIAAELHTHTMHSDGSFTPETLVSAAKTKGFDALAITDHNCIASVHQVQQQAKKAGIAVIPGMELTTFYGHVLSIGTKVYLEWRDARKQNGLAMMAERIHDAGGLCGIAHPFKLGGWMCTGCYMDYAMDALASVDYIEVWNGEKMHQNPFNRRAYRWWLSLLDQGMRLPATAGRDWHNGQDAMGDLHAATYLGIPQEEAVCAEALLQSIQKGRVAVTYGLLPILRVKKGNDIHVQIEKGRGGKETLRMRLLAPKGKLVTEMSVTAGDEYHLHIQNFERLHAEVWDGEELIGFTSPIYAE